MASEATKMAIIGNMHIGSKVLEVIEHHHMPISHSPCCRRSKGPLPSCSREKDEKNAEQACIEGFVTIQFLGVHRRPRRRGWQRVR